MATIENQIEAILDAGCPLYELIGRLGEVCNEKALDEDDPHYLDIGKMLADAAFAAETANL